jgi:hypothetical protein
VSKSKRKLKIVPFSNVTKKRFKVQQKAKTRKQVNNNRKLEFKLNKVIRDLKQKMTTTISKMITTIFQPFTKNKLSLTYNK